MEDSRIIDVMVVGEDGRVTIPHKIREELGLTKGDRVMWILENGRPYLKKI